MITVASLADFEKVFEKLKILIWIFGMLFGMKQRRGWNMFRVIFVSCLLSLSALQGQDFFDVSRAIGTQLATCIDEKKKVEKISLLDLQSSEGPTEFAQIVPELILEVIQQKTDIDTVTRTQFDLILKEHKLKLSGLMDPENQKKLGKFSSIDALVVGKYREFGEFILVTVQVIHVETAESLCSVSQKLPKTEDIKSILVPKDIPEITDDRGETYVIPQETVTEGTQNQVHFQIQKCRVQGKNIRCDVLLTNMSEDKNIGFYRSHSVMTNQVGHSSKSTDFVNGGGVWRSGWFNFNLITGVPTRVSVVFGNGVKDSKLLRVLELRYKLENADYKIQFRNIRVDQ
ncbi:hypothetical protein [Acanthopleuribacter pedis]|uniref:Uncharacterized protein n=1 Tax=Acanthopleuribacter pedis TaxID=442870 RepID=A0A8J7U4U0_9BACT|nr:hypothetical protein [Acanthopleuribacter pedis]MBO1321002.1 hypothetical protein [Acanthopleuribacter pedis]